MQYVVIQVLDADDEETFRLPSTGVIPNVHLAQ
jgi:hypothetical protein